MIAAARAVLALMLLVVFYALVVLLVLVWLAFLVLGLWSAGAPESQTPPTTVILACAAFAPILVGMVWAVVRTARPAAPPENAVWVSRRRAPALWAAVDELAGSVGTAPPDAIRLTAEVNASVTEHASFLGLVPGRRTLYLGLPLLVGLPPAELRAVLAHELGHFSRRHGRFGALAYRGTAGLAAACEAVRSAAAANDLVRMYAGGPLLLLRGYTWVFRRLTRPVRRRQEIEADREAARVAGARTVADALRSVAALEQAWLEFVAGFLTPVRRAEGRVPDDPFRAFAHMVEAPERREPFAALRARAAERPADHDDPHPDLAIRLSRLARLPDQSAGGGIAEPLDVPSGYAVELGRTLYPGRYPGSSTARSMPWREWLGLLAEHRATRLLKPLAEAVRTVEEAEGISETGTGENGTGEAGTGGPSGLTIHRVLRLLDSGRRMPLARALGSHLPPGEGTGRNRTGRNRTGRNRTGRNPAERNPAERDPLGLLAEALYVLIGAQLVARGSAHWTMNWTGPGALVPPEGLAPESIREWADTAVRQPGQTQRLGLYLAALGVNERAPLPEAAGDTVRGPIRKGADARLTRPSGAQISIVPGVDEPARRRISGIRVLALTVLLGMTGVSWLLWADREERPYPRPAWQRVNPTGTYDPAPGGTGLTGEVPGISGGASGGISGGVSGGIPGWPPPAPTPSHYWLPTGLARTPGLSLGPSVGIEPLVPRSRTP